MNLTSTIFSVYYTELIWPAFSKVNEKWEKSILHSVLHLSEILSNNKYFGNQPFVMLQKAVIPHQSCCLLNTPRLPLGLILTCGTTQHPSFPGNRNQAFLQGLGVSRTSWSLLFFLRNVCISLQQRSPDRWIEQRPVDAVTVFDDWIHWHNSDTEQEEISSKTWIPHVSQLFPEALLATHPHILAVMVWQTSRAVEVTCALCGRAVNSHRPTDEQREGEKAHRAVKPTRDFALQHDLM